MFQQPWKKKPSKPLGPGALSELREKTIFLISSLERNLTNIEFSSSNNSRDMSNNHIFPEICRDIISIRRIIYIVL